MDRRVYADISDLPDAVDLAILTIEAHRAVDAAKKCAEKGFRALIILASGFSEVDEEGMQLELELRHRSSPRGRGYSARTRWAVSFPDRSGHHFCRAWRPDVRAARRSDVHYPERLRRRGAGGVRRHRLGVAGVYRIGEQAGRRRKRIIGVFCPRRFWTRCIAVYLETFQDGLEFIELCRTITPRKPVVVLKAGRSEVALKAIASTGKMASAVDIFYGAGKQAGIILAKNEEQLTVFRQILPPHSCRRSRRGGYSSPAGGDQSLPSI